MITFKFYLDSTKVNLNLVWVFGEKFNTNLNYYLHKLIELNKKTNTIFIYYIFIVLLISLSLNTYFLTFLIENLDYLIDLHINIKNKR